MRYYGSETPPLLAVEKMNVLTRTSLSPNPMSVKFQAQKRVENSDICLSCLDVKMQDVLFGCEDARESKDTERERKYRK